MWDRSSASLRLASMSCSLDRFGPVGQVGSERVRRPRRTGARQVDQKVLTEDQRQEDESNDD